MPLLSLFLSTPAPAGQPNLWSVLKLYLLPAGAALLGHFFKPLSGGFEHWLKKRIDRQPERLDRQRLTQTHREEIDALIQTLYEGFNASRATLLEYRPGPRGQLLATCTVEYKIPRLPPLKKLCQRQPLTASTLAFAERIRAQGFLHLLDSQDVLLVPDAEVRAAAHYFQVKEAFYHALLTSRDGQWLGMVSVSFNTPRGLTPDDLEGMKITASAVQQILRSVRAEEAADD